MDIILNEIEIRVLGSLMEKALSTPDYYPLSLNALTNACNQKSSRDPVSSYEESTLEAAAEGLDQKGLLNKSNVGRVPKYEERFSQKFNFVPRETAVMCVLLLRGPQTTGEIRSRTSRLCNFENLEAVLKTLKNLEEWSLVRRLTRLAGRKESRIAHCLGGDTNIVEPEKASTLSVAAPVSAERIEKLELAVEPLQNEIEDLKKSLKNTVETSTPANTPKPIGPYNHIAKVGQFISIGGTAGVDPATGQLAGADVYSQAKQIIESFEVMLKSVDSDLKNIIHVNVFLKDMRDFDEMNRAYIEILGDHRPARTVIGVSELPKPGVLLTMNLTAVTME
jgi:reactive intermediate/imine deaminase